MAAWLIPGWIACQANDSLTQAEAERRLNQLKTEIGSLQNELDRTRTTLSSEQKALKAADLEIQTSALELRKLESTRQVHDRELSVLNTERRSYLDSLDQRREILATQIMAAYRLGRSTVIASSSTRCCGAFQGARRFCARCERSRRAVRPHDVGPAVIKHNGENQKSGGLIARHK